MKHSGWSLHHVQSIQQCLLINLKIRHNKADRNLQRKMYADSLKPPMTKEELSVFREK
jgi:cytochrome b involved in lipid metabolism